MKTQLEFVEHFQLQVGQGLNQGPGPISTR